MTFKKGFDPNRFEITKMHQFTLKGLAGGGIGVDAILHSMGRGENLVCLTANSTNLVLI